MIIGIVGERGCGKGTLASYLQDKHNAVIYRYSDTFRETLNILNLPIIRENLAAISLALRTAFGEDILSKVMVENIKKSESKIIILDGIRRIGDIKYIEDLEDFKLVYIESQEINRFNRLKNRGENNNESNMDFKDFQKEGTFETELRIKAMKETADIIIENDGEVEEFYDKIDNIVG